MVYVASPFTYKTKIPLVRTIMEFIRFLHVSYIGARLENLMPDYAFILPITTSYVTQKLAKIVSFFTLGRVPALGGEWASWERTDKTYLTKCDLLIVIMMDKWDQSVGVQAEIKFFQSLKRPIIYMSPDLKQRSFSITMKHINSPVMNNAIRAFSKFPK